MERVVVRALRGRRVWSILTVLSVAVPVVGAPPEAVAPGGARTLTWDDVARLADADPRLAAKGFRVAAARGGEAAAGEVPNPTLEASVGRIEGRAGSASGKAAALSLTIPLGWLPQRGARVASARAETRVAEAETGLLRREVLLQLRTLFWEVATDQARLQSLEELEGHATIETAVAGKIATVLIEDQRRFAVAVRFPEADRSDLPEVERLLVPAPGGERVPLAQLARFEVVEAPAQVSRENGMRRVVAEANVRDRDLGGFVREVQARLAPLVRELPAGYSVEYGGQFENQQRAMRQLAIVVPVALLLVVILLYLALGSVWSSLLVLLNLPFALVGGVLAMVAFRMPLSVSAAVAFIVLLGVAVQNGVVLVSFFRQLRERGCSVAETVERGCSLRFRPLLMTALTSFIGHLPMLYATGSGADIQRPLAVVVMGGLVTSTALTLLVLPTLYALLASRFAADGREVARRAEP